MNFSCLKIPYSLISPGIYFMTMGIVDIPQSCASCSVDGRKIKLGIQWSKIKLNGFINDNMTIHFLQGNNHCLYRH